MNNPTMAEARLKLTEMLLALSDEALEYAWRPIAYAYYYTDGRAPDRLTSEDAARLTLIGVAAHGDAALVYRLNQCLRDRWHAERKEASV